MSTTNIKKGEIDKGGDWYDHIDRVVRSRNPSNGIVPTIDITKDGNTKTIEYESTSERDSAFEKMTNP